LLRLTATNKRQLLILFWGPTST